MKKASVKSPANIALIKYWGKTDSRWRIPANSSISMCLSEMFSTCTIEFQSQLSADDIKFEGEPVVKPLELDRISKVLDRVRTEFAIDQYARVVTKNNFPKGVGIASSASGLSAITMAAVAAAGQSLSTKELSKMSRLASGTACRSIPDGFVEWIKGSDHDSSYGVSIFPADHWQICDVIAIVQNTMKKVSSTNGHEIAPSSPFYQVRLSGLDQKISDLKTAIKQRDFSKFGQIIEAEALNMHAVCLTSNPSLIYIGDTTLNLMKHIMTWRDSIQLESYFTIDAGPTIHAFCKLEDSERLKEQISQVPGVERVVINHPSNGAQLIDQHLF